MIKIRTKVGLVESREKMILPLGLKETLYSSSKNTTKIVQISKKIQKLSL
jgi:hypothetical protein